MSQTHKTLFITAILALFFVLPQTISAQNSDSIQTDTVTVKQKREKKERKGCKLFKHKKDTLQAESDSLSSDTTQTKRKKLFGNKKDKKKKGATGKAPKRPGKAEWKGMTREDKEAYFKECNDYDSTIFVDENYTDQELGILNRAIAIDKEVSMRRVPSDTLSNTDVDILKTVGRKDARLHDQMAQNDYKRRKKMLKFDKSGDFKLDSTMAYEEKIEILKARYEYEASKEAIRKQKIAKRYTKKENRLRKKYELSDQEKSALAKGKSMRLRGAELAHFNKGKKKQEVFTVKLQKLRKKRALAIQNKQTKRRILKERREDKKRDAQINKGRNDKNIKKHEKETKKRIKKNRKK